MMSIHRENESRSMGLPTLRASAVRSSVVALERGDTPAPWNPPGHRSAAPAWRPHSILGRARPLSLSSRGTPCPRGLWMCPGGSPVAGAPSPRNVVARARPGVRGSGRGAGPRFGDAPRGRIQTGRSGPRRGDPRRGPGLRRLNGDVPSNPRVRESPRPRGGQGQNG